MTESKSSRNIDWHEINRKMLHIVGGLIISALIYFDLINAWAVLVAIIIGSIISFLYVTQDIPIFDFFLKKFEREHLRKRFPGKGIIFLFLAIFIMLISFDKHITIAGMMIWTFGDSMSAIVGKHYGKIRHPLNNKRLMEGTAAGALAGAIAAAFFVNWIYALVASMIAMTVESIEWKLYADTLDDNFFVPLIGAFVVQILIWIF